MLNKIQGQIATLSPREKTILLGTVVVLLGAIWKQAFYLPIQAELASIQQNLATAELEIKTQQQIAKQVESQQTIDPNQSNREQLAQLQEEHDQLQQQLNLGGKKFVPPQLMASALRDMLAQNQHLALAKLSTLPVKTLLSAEKQDHPIYIHGLEITFSGNYVDTLAYLKSLETLPWHLQWESIAYQVKSYPLAETTIRAYTLSFEESWLGI